MEARQLDRDWRARLTHDVGWWLFAKLSVLTVLWALFFSGAHRSYVDGTAAANRLGLAAAQSSLRETTKLPKGDCCD
jgi:hypothetical protein